MASTGIDRNATTASSAARNAAMTSSIDDTGYDSDSGLLVEGSIALKDPVGLAGCRHSPAIKTGSSAMRVPTLSLFGLVRPRFARHFVLQRHRGDAVRAADGDGNDVTVGQREVLPRDDARSRRQDRALRKVELHEQEVGQLVQRALDLRRPRLARERDAARARDLQGDRQIAQAIRVADVDAGADRARAVVDLRLRQVERVVALDVARRHVVADGVTDDLTGAVDDQRQLRLGDVPLAVVADADRHAVSGHAPAVRL